MSDQFGGETMVVGEVTEPITALNGVRVRLHDDVGTSWSKTRVGTIYAVYVNRQTRVAQIWVNMDGGGARCFRPYHLTVIDKSLKHDLLSLEAA